MKAFKLVILILFYSINVDAQNEPRLVLPVGHTGLIISSVFSPDGKLVLTGSTDNTARIYEVSSGKELHLLKGNTGEIISAVFSKDGKLAMTASRDETVRIYEVSTGKEIQVLKKNRYFYHSSYLYSADFNLDGRILMTSSDTTWIHEVISGKEIHKLKGGSGVFSPDGKMVMTIDHEHYTDVKAIIYEVSTGKEMRVYNKEGGSGSYQNPVFSPDSKMLLIERDSIPYIYELASGKEIKILRKKSLRINNFIFSNDCKKLIISSSDSTARIYEAATGKEINVINTNNFDCKVCFTPDDSMVMTNSSMGNSIHIYQVSTGKEINILIGNTEYIHSTSYSPDGKMVVTSGSDGTARIYEIATGKEIKVLKGYTYNINSVIYSPNGKMAISTSIENIISIYEVETGKELHTLKGNKGFFCNEGSNIITVQDDTIRINDVATGKVIHILKGYNAFLSNDGRKVLTTTNDSMVQIYDISTGKLLKALNSNHQWTYFAFFSSDDRRILTLDCEKENWCSWRIHDIASGEEIQVVKVHRDYDFIYEKSGLYSPNGRVVLTSPNENITNIYEIDKGKETMLKNIGGFNQYANTFSVFSDDSRIVLIAKFFDQAHIYDVDTGKELQIINNPVPYDFIYEPYPYTEYAVFSKNNKMVFWVTKNSASIYDVATGKVLQVLNLHTNMIKSASFSPDGKYILTTHKDCKTIVWNISNGKALYTRLQLEGENWLAYDEHYRFDGTEGAINYLYLTCGLEVIDLAQVKDSLWVPGLVEKIMKGEEIKINDKPAPKLSDLNICDLTPQIEQLNKDEKGIFKYKITPRKGGLGETEIYINGNLTYSLKPSQLEKKLENKKEVYYLTISTDSLQSYLVGELNSKNPILVKSKVKGAGIYGRGSTSTIIKTTKQEMPHFYGVFVGVNEYGNPSKEENDFRYKNLDFAKKDAEDLANTVEATAKTLFKENCHIYRLTSTLVNDSLPNKSNLIKVLNEIGMKANANDILYLFFAGHGDIIQKYTEKEIRFILQNADKKNLNSSSFGIDELTEWCQPKNIKAQKRVFVFDACHSGQVINQTLAFNGRGDDESNRIRQLDKLKDKNGMMILAASADNESAYEDESLNQGVLTYHLLQVVKQQQKDTSLIVRNWFDETIELVKEYSRMNGNKQEPSSFGDGRFEIGNIDKSVRNSVSIEKPKIRIGNCTFIDPLGDAENLYPNLKDKINTYFKNSSTRGDFVFSKNSDKSYKIVGAYTLVGKNKLKIGYKIYLAEEQLGSTITFPLFKNKSEDEIYEILLNSIEENLKKLNNIEKNN